MDEIKTLFKQLTTTLIMKEKKVAVRECVICMAVTHATDQCPTLYEEEVNAIGGHHGRGNNGNRNYDPNAQTYNPGWRNQENFRLNNNNHQGAGQPQHQQQNKGPSLTDMVQTILCETTQNLDKYRQEQTKLAHLSTAVAQMQRRQGELPPKVEVHETQVNAVSLRSGKPLPEKVFMPSEDILTKKGKSVAKKAVEIQSDISTKKDEEENDQTIESLEDGVEDKGGQDEEREARGDEEPKYIKPNPPKIKPPFPAVLKRKIPKKYEDPGMFVIPCVIGSRRIDRAMLDLGASINVMPLALFKELNLGPLKATRVVIQLADRSLDYPKGILEDVLVKEENLIFPADFYVLDMGKTSSRTSVILLGRPFMKTARTCIDCDSGTLTCEFDGEKVKFNIFQAMEHLMDTEIVETMVEIILPIIGIQDPLVLILQEGIIGCPRKYNEEIFHTLIYLRCQEGPIRSLPNNFPILMSEVRLVPSLEKPPQLNLKPLAKHLKYIYLGTRDTLPMIISSELTIEEENQVKDVIGQYKEAIGWTLADIKGISPSLCVHHILMEEEAKPVQD
ncbi:uncharacterized protein LOC131018625 [Salvia miltiorrhiza]|uniref:uncharacterized protein LOC131018625 n=1 Tax=Salvia miltiorrhiza TaxID=226208 RepID=UPI0025AC5D01|nr:uncharacterized protein LOC131018625 [Salvia miltiorrhiza]